MDFKRIDENYVNPVLPKHFIYDYNVKLYPLSGIPNKPVVSCNENGYFATYNNDRFGFNNPDKEWDQSGPPPKKKHTFGGSTM